MTTSIELVRRLPERGAPGASDGASAPPSTRGRLILTVLVVSAFGPYLYRGIRTEQLAAYGLAATLLPVLWPRIRLPGSLRVVVAAWLALICVAVISWLSPPAAGRYWSGSPLANLDNLLMPVAVVAVTLSVLSLGGDRDLLLRRVAGLVVVATSLNALLALAQTRLPLDGYLHRWWSLTGGDTGATKVMTLDRYTGALNQPALAGVLYGIGAMCALYLLHGQTSKLLIVMTVLTVGGVVAVSKAFFLVSLPVVAWHLFRVGGKGQQRFVIVTGAVVALYGLALGGVLAALPQVERVLALVPSSQTSLISEYSGNRYGSDATTTPVVGAVLDAAPFAGLGLPGVGTATDSAWVEVLVLSGLLGAVALAVALLALVFGYRHQRRSMAESERRLLGGVVAILIIGTFGFPVLTGNRLVVVVWVLITLMLAPSGAATRRASEAFEAK